MKSPLLRASWLGLAAHALNAAAATATVSGTVSYPDGTPDPQALVVLYQCATPAEARCSAYARETGTDTAGHYAIAFDGLDGSATYQLVFVDWSGRDGNLPSTRSAQFSPAAGSLTIDGQLRPWKLTLSGVAWDQASVPVGGSANLSFSVANNSGAPIALDAWLGVVVAPTGTAVDTSYFQRGAAGKAQPLTLTLATGETRTVTLPFSLPTGALSGSGGMANLWISQQGTPTAIVAAYDYLYFEVVKAGSARLQAGDAARARRVEQLRNERLQLLHTPTPMLKR